MPVAVSDTSQFNPRGLPHLTIPSRWLEDDFAAWLEERMEQRGMSQRMLALRAGVSHSSVSRLLSGDRSPSLPTALALLRVLAAEPAATHLASQGKPARSTARPPPDPPGLEPKVVRTAILRAGFAGVASRIDTD